MSCDDSVAVLCFFNFVKFRNNSFFYQRVSHIIRDDNNYFQT